MQTAQETIITAAPGAVEAYPDFPAITAWAGAHPLWAALGLWLFVTLITWVTKPRTPADYAAMNPRLAALLQLLAATFGDGRKIIEAAGKLLTGKAKPIVIAPTTRPEDEPVDPAEAKVRSESRGAASVVALILMAAFSLALLLFACNPHDLARTAAAADRVETKRVTFRGAILECARTAKSCPEFDACQAAIAADAGLPQHGGECVDVSHAQALDAGLLPDDGGRL